MKKIFLVLPMLIALLLSACFAAAPAGPTPTPDPLAIKGQQIFNSRCATCHALDAAQKRPGPHLDGIIGRKAGSVEGVRYSRALQDSGIVWDVATLDNFLANPRIFAVFGVFQGIYAETYSLNTPPTTSDDLQISDLSA